MVFQVLTAEISHETNSFSLQETDEQAFLRRYLLIGEEAIAERGQANTELAGFLDVGRSWLACESRAQRCCRSRWQSPAGNV